LELSSLKPPAVEDDANIPCFVGTCSAVGAYIWDVGDPDNPFREHGHFYVPVATQARCLAFSRSGNLVAVGTRDSIFIWNIASGACVVKWLWTEGSVLEAEQESSLSWNFDDSRLAFSVGNQVAVINVQE